MNFKIKYPDGSTKEISAFLFNGFLCRQVSVQKGFKFVKKRTNPDPYDDCEAEYETVRKPNYETDFLPFFNRTALEQSGKMGEVQKLAKRAKTFSDHKGYEKYMFKIGENEGGVIVEEN
jgi:hypothetical protein